MVQLKYFGDSRDYFKYDLITFVLKNNNLTNYVFIPMLTNHRIDNEGNKTPKHILGKSQELLSYINNCDTKNLNHWQRWLSRHIKFYHTIEPVHEIFFDDEKRESYWSEFLPLAKLESSLIFIDPDTGLETGTPGYLKKSGREKYILNYEIYKLYDALDPSSIMLIYQHLPNNKHIHTRSVERKIMQLVEACNCGFVIAYREDDLAFMFLFKSVKLYLLLRNLLNEYHSNSGHKYKSIHFSLDENIIGAE